MRGGTYLQVWGLTYTYFSGKLQSQEITAAVRFIVHMDSNQLFLFFSLQIRSTYLKYRPKVKVQPTLCLQDIVYVM